MVDPTRYPDSDGDVDAQQPGGWSTRSKVIAAAVAVLVVVIVALHLTGVVGAGH